MSERGDDETPPEDTTPGPSGDENPPEMPPGEDAPIQLPIEPVIDLHAFLAREVESVVEEYLLEAHRAGFEEIRIIHGRGIGFQREIVRAVLARTPFVESFRDAPPERGGWGATLAWLRLDRLDRPARET